MPHRPYIPHVRSPVMAVPGNRERIARALVHSGRGVTYFRGLGVPNVTTDEQIQAAADAPGGSAYHNVNVIQCALNSLLTAVPHFTPLAVDGKWGPKTATALSQYIAWLLPQLAAPDVPSNYVYQTPSAGASVVYLTNALYHALTSGQDISTCLGQGAALPRPPAGHVSTTIAGPAPSAAPAATHDWTTWGIAAAGVAALGIIGVVVYKSRKRGRR